MNMKKQSHVEQIYYYKLYSLRRIPTFLKYSWATAKNIVAAEKLVGGVNL